MPRKAVKYAVVDAFTDSPFKGNPAVVCLLESGEEDDKWMQAVATEFNINVTAFIYRDGEATAASVPRFVIRWFTPTTEVYICGHATLAATYFLLTSGVVKCNTIDFVTKFGLLRAKRSSISKHLVVSKSNTKEAEDKFAIELDFPLNPIVACDSSVAQIITKTLNGASVANFYKANNPRDIIVELKSWKDLISLHPNFDEIRQCPGRGVTITALAPSESGYDFFTRFFCPKDGVDEDPVCGSAHCALAPFWSKKLGKSNMIAYMASRRGGRLYLQVDEGKNQVHIKGEATTTMVGTLVV